MGQRKFKFNVWIPNVKDLPAGIENDDELTKIVCEFKLGRFENKEKFVLAYTRLSIHRAVVMSRHEKHVHDLIGVALLTLNGIPYEVHEGKLIDYNIVGYTMGRIKTRCIEYIRNDFVFHTTYHYLRQGHAKLKQQQDNVIIKETGEMSEIESRYVAPNVDLSDIREMLKKSIKTDGERMVINYREMGYKDDEIAKLFGCSEFKVRAMRTNVEMRFNIIRSSLEHPDFVKVKPR